MRFPASRGLWAVLATAAVLMALNRAYAQEESQKGAQNPYLKGSEGYYKGPRGLTSYQPVAIDQPFAATMAHDVAAKPGIEREHQALLEQRYDLSDHPAQDVTMEHGKPLQEGVRVKLPTAPDIEAQQGLAPNIVAGLLPRVENKRLSMSNRSLVVSPQHGGNCSLILKDLQQAVDISHWNFVHDQL